MSLKIRRDGNYVGVVSPFWQVIHDVARGGTIAEVRITYGSNGNLLRKPVAANVDSYSESRENKPRLTIKESGNKIFLTFAGLMRDSAGRDGGIRYEHKYIYSLYYIRNELRIVPPGKTAVNTVTACSIELDGSLDEYTWGSTDFEKLKPRYLNLIGPHYEDIWGNFNTAKGVLLSENRRPWQVSIFARGKEGLAWVGDSKQYSWDTPLAGKKQAGFTLEKLADSSRIIMSPIKTGAGQKSAEIDKPLEFSWYLILPNVREKGRKKLFPVYFSSSPFPCDDQIRAMAKSGVNVISTMDDTDYRNKTINYWHDGEFPPYPPEKMKELSRFLKVCHSYGIAVIPYFAGRILSTETPAFAKFAREWYAAAIPEGHLRYHPAPMAGSQGCFVCPDSGWIKFLERYIKRCVDELGFDGYYLDYGTPGVCFNTRHLPGEHTMTDGLTSLVENLRDWLGNDRLMIAHAGGGDCWQMLPNIADGVVTLEEGRKDGGVFSKLEDYPPSISFMGSGSVSLVPNVFFSRPEYKDKKQLLHQGVAHAALLNTVVFPFTFWYDLFGYENWQEAFSDPAGIYAMYKRLKDIDFTKYKFFDPWSGVALTSRKNVRAAVYVGDKNAIVVAGNFGTQAVASATVRVEIPGKTGVTEKTVEIGPLKKNGVEFKKLKW